MTACFTGLFGVLAVLTTCATGAVAATCYESQILSPTPFMGNSGEVFKLDDGSVWEVGYEYEYLYEYYPTVLLCPTQGRMRIGDRWLDVKLLAAPSDGSAPLQGAGAWELFEETNLAGSISGTVEAGRVFKTTSGHIFEVTGLTLQLVLELQPDVTILRDGNLYKLVVDGFDEPLLCRCLNCDPIADRSSAQPVNTAALIKAVQVTLEALRYDPGPATGGMTLRTRVALAKFNAASRGAATDSVDAQTLQDLARALESKYPDETAALTVATYLNAAATHWPPHTSDERHGRDMAPTHTVESYIVSDFDGLEHGNVYKLANGQLWEQTEYWVWVWVWVNPEVLIWESGGTYRMKVEGIDHPVTVRRLK